MCHDTVFRAQRKVPTLHYVFQRIRRHTGLALQPYAALSACTWQRDEWRMSTNSDRLDATTQPPHRAGEHPPSDARPIETPSESPIAAYGNVTPERIHTVARAFIQRMRGLNDDQARKYAAMHPDQVLPAQLHEMHRYLSYNYPEALARSCASLR
jgi:hypothetical protein